MAVNDEIGRAIVALAKEIAKVEYTGEALHHMATAARELAEAGAWLNYPNQPH
jgi:hypothetical protein